MASILIAGATGAVGREVLRLALADEKRVGHVVAPTRRALPPHPRLENPLVEYESIAGSEPWWHVDAVICALGTTIKKVGSQAAFRKVDHEYPLLVARHALLNGARSYALNSSVGADAGSKSFYLRTKGEVERDLDELGYCSYTIVRPSVIWGERQEVRLGESVAIFALTALKPVVPRRYRVVPAARIAKALLDRALAGVPGRKVIESEEL
ncbi:NAD(P)H-binding protein [Haloferula sp. BvORR071]|uniref:NAD(P)H-binding protein n=1 Tax=Haloferula sp. BvORR071 TaxID=1396141 RepID=UPI000554E000|nr:NAD(P)H-binding protein [Haloferula sp. BvORR071]